MQRPPMQACLDPHRLLQAPQLFVSRSVSVHVPLQQRSPAGQRLPHVPQFRESNRVSTHTPLQQLWLARQPWPQKPQLYRLVLVSTQDPLQQVGAAAGQTLPQLPQCCESSRVLRQTPVQQLPRTSGQQKPLQKSRPMGQGTHRPWMHTRPAAHTLPQVPQFRGSDCVTVHAPLQMTSTDEQRHTPLAHN